MDDVREIDTVLQHVRQALQRLQIPSNIAISQQILLLGDSYYGYRYTATDFTAVWSAADRTLKIFDNNAKMLESLFLTEQNEEIITSPTNGTLPQQLRAA